MEAFFVSLLGVAVAEIGDRTQLLSLVLAARFRKPWPIIGGVLVATLLNHGAAGALGVMFAGFMTPFVLDSIVAATMLGMGLWSLWPDKLDDDGAALRGTGAFAASLIAFFIAETGDKTQIATITLAAAYSNLWAVVAGSTLGMLAANVPVIFLGNAFADRLPLRAIRFVAAGLFICLGAAFLAKALGYSVGLIF